MQVKTVLSTTTMLAGIAVFGGTAYGADYAWVGGSGTGWRTPANWDLNNGDYPNGASDTAVIDPASAATVNLDLGSGAVSVGDLTIGEHANVFVIASSGNDYLTINGILTIESDGQGNDGTLWLGNASGDPGRLLIENDASPTTHPIGGDIILLDNESEILIASDGQVFGPFTYTDPEPDVDVYGMVEGWSASASFLIEEDPSSGNYTFTSAITFAGQMTIEPEVMAGAGTATFNNEGVVRANADAAVGEAVLTLAADLRLDDNSDAEWRADSHDTAVLEFNEAASLSGDFVLLDDATLRFFASVSTTGCFDDDNSCGTVDTTASGSVCFGAAGCGGYTECGIATLSGGC